MFSVAVSGAYDLEDRTRLSVRVGLDTDRLMPGRVEFRADVVMAREAEPGQDADGLIPDRPDALDDGVRIRLRVLERALEIVDYRQPLGGDRGLGLRRGAANLGRAPLAYVVGVGQRPQPLVLRFGKPALQVGNRGVAAGRGFRAGSVIRAARGSRAGRGVRLPLAGSCLASLMGRELCVNHVVVGIGRQRLGRLGRRAALRRDSA